MCIRDRGCPIRKSPDQRLFAPPRSLSQLITSFIASESLSLIHIYILIGEIWLYTGECETETPIDIAPQPYIRLFQTKKEISDVYKRQNQYSYWGVTLLMITTSLLCTNQLKRVIDSTMRCV